MRISVEYYGGAPEQRAAGERGGGELLPVAAWHRALRAFGTWLYGRTQVRIHEIVTNGFLSLANLDLPPSRVGALAGRWTQARNHAERHRPTNCRCAGWVKGMMRILIVGATERSAGDWPRHCSSAARTWFAWFAPLNPALRRHSATPAVSARGRGPGGRGFAERATAGIDVVYHLAHLMAADGDDLIAAESNAAVRLGTAARRNGVERLDLPRRPGESAASNHLQARQRTAEAPAERLHSPTSEPPGSGQRIVRPAAVDSRPPAADRVPGMARRTGRSRSASTRPSNISRTRSGSMARRVARSRSGASRR